MDMIRVIENYASQINMTTVKIEEIKSARLVLEGQLDSEQQKRTKILTELSSKQAALSKLTLERKRLEAEMGEVHSHNQILKEDISAALASLVEMQSTDRADREAFIHRCQQTEQQLLSEMKSNRQKS